MRTLYFHPLSNIPGPKSWIVSRLPFIRHLLQGSIVQQIDLIHEKYGGVVRTGPDEVSFAVPDAWQDIYELRSGHPPVSKDETW